MLRASSRPRPGRMWSLKLKVTGKRFKEGADAEKKSVEETAAEATADVEALTPEP